MGRDIHAHEQTVHAIELALPLAQLASCLLHDIDAQRYDQTGTLSRWNEF